MKNAKTFWLESKPIQLPFVATENDYTIQEVTISCPDCNKQVEEMRGEIKESFGCIEMRVSGICKPCKLVIDNRTRIYPKQHRFLTLKNNEWYEGEMKVSFFQKVIDFFRMF